MAHAQKLTLEEEMSRVWGNQRVGDTLVPKRRRNPKTNALMIDGEGQKRLRDEGDDSDGSELAAEEQRAERHKKAKTEARRNKKEKSMDCKLHCFVDASCTRLDVLDVFEAYNPKVVISTSQKGNALNKTHAATLTFPSKAMAMHAVLMLDGTNQRDTMGINPLKLSLALSRNEIQRIKRERSKSKKSN